jgi:uncharacterized protein (TIGR03435 family)
MKLFKGLLIIGLGFAIPHDAPGQNEAKPPSASAFEVASIRPTESGTRGRSMGALPGGKGYVVKNWPVRFMLRRVYHVINDQILKGPGWMSNDCYDIEAEAAQPSSTVQLEKMFQDLLADRFHLQLHRETRELPVYALIFDKKGPRLKVNETADEFSGRIAPNIVNPRLGGLPGMSGVGVSMTELCWSLAQVVERPVVDETALKGRYDFKLEYVMPPQGVPVLMDTGELPPTVEGPTIFSALPEQLGLRLRPQKGDVEVLVIDHIERPSAN